MDQKQHLRKSGLKGENEIPREIRNLKSENQCMKWHVDVSEQEHFQVGKNGVES